LTDDAELEHFEFLADDDQDPRERFIDSLCDALGPRGKIVVYNASFERQRLQDLAGWLPKYAARIGKSTNACGISIRLSKSMSTIPSFAGHFRSRPLFKLSYRRCHMKDWRSLTGARRASSGIA